MENDWENHPFKRVYWSKTSRRLALGPFNSVKKFASSNCVKRAVVLALSKSWIAQVHILRCNVSLFIHLRTPGHVGTTPLPLFTPVYAKKLNKRKKDTPCLTFYVNSKQHFFTSLHLHKHSFTCKSELFSAFFASLYRNMSKVTKDFIRNLPFAFLHWSLDWLIQSRCGAGIFLDWVTIPPKTKKKQNKQ